MESKLTEEARRELDFYMNEQVPKILYRKLIPTAAIASVLGLVMGWMVNESARSLAYEKAMDLFSGKVTDAAEQVGKAKGDAELHTQNVRAIEFEIRKLFEDTKNRNAELQKIINSSTTASQIAKP